MLLPTFVLASWIVTETMVEETSGEEFCGGCHTMKPMVAAYRRSLHGGAGPEGVQAKCNQCHVPHDNAVIYIVQKARFGIQDVWAQLTYDLDAIDWHELREHREGYVFDSGCLQCHNDLRRASRASAVTFVAHQPYFLGEIESKCVTCHQHVGHSNLAAHLPETSKGDQ